MDKIFIGELIGTFVLILFGAGTCAANSLKKSYAHNTGWVFIVFGWGFGVFAGAMVSAPLSGAHLNPALSIAFFAKGDMTISQLGVYVLAQMIGAILGSALVYQLYYEHFRAEEELKTPCGGIFFTGPAVRNIPRNLLSEIVGTFILVIFILMVGHDKTSNSLFVPFLIVGIGIALGSLTGYAINPARDLGPRIMYSLTKLNKMHPADWSYAFVPVLGPIIGGLLATGLYITVMSKML